MRLSTGKHFLMIVTAFAIATLSSARAQTFPDRPIRIIAPFPAGGLVDVLARALGDEMSKSLGQPVIVETNRAQAAILAPTSSRRRRPTDTRC